MKVEYTSSGARIKVLLQLFANLTIAEWRQLPRIDNHWIRIGSIERSLSYPLEGFALILVGTVRGGLPNWTDEELILLLEDICDLIECWMMVHPDSARVFAAPADEDVPLSGQLSVVRVLGRLCREALMTDTMRQQADEGLKAEDLLATFARPA
jgi:hypothetical protein